MLVTTIDNACQLQELFKEYGREDHFSYEGYQAMFDYLDSLSDDIGEDFKVDVIAICCDFTEYEGWEDLYNDYTHSYNNEEESWEDTDQEAFKEWVQDRTTAIECIDYKDNITGVIVQCF